MNKCECQCGADVKGRFVRGHQFRKRARVAQPEEQLPSSTPASGVSTYAPLTRQEIAGSTYSIPSPPPPHPLPFDHGKFRVSEERPGVDRAQPWLAGRCGECREITWSHSARDVERQEILCESCYYFAVTGMAEQRVNNENRIRVIPRFDPFE